MLHNLVLHVHSPEEAVRRGDNAPVKSRNAHATQDVGRSRAFRYGTRRD
jgi:hypothetical protein